MFGLILAVISLLFISLILMAGTGYIDLSKIIRLTETIEVEKKLNKIEAIISEYETKFNSIPSDNVVLGNYIKNGFRIGSKPLSEIKVFDDGMTIDYSYNMIANTNGYPIEICFGSDEMTENQYGSILQAKKNILRKNNPNDKMTISDTCGDIVDLDFTTLPDVVWVTYRIK